MNVNLHHQGYRCDTYGWLEAIFVGKSNSERINLHTVEITGTKSIITQKLILCL